MMLTTASLAGCGASSSSGFTLNSGGLTDSKPITPAVTAQGTDPGSVAAAGPVRGTNTASVASGLVTPSPSGVGAAQTVAKLTDGQKRGSKAYLIGTDDLLEVTVFKVPDLTKSVQVADTGIITFPLIGNVEAAGRTTADLERELASKLGSKYLQNPQVSVFVKEYNSQRVLVDGSFAKPGVYPVRGNATLLQYVATSGGLTPNAQSTLVVFRNVDGKQMAARFEIEEIRSGKSPDPEIKAGDVIVASSDAFKEGLDKVLRAIPLIGAFAQVAAL